MNHKTINLSFVIPSFRQVRLLRKNLGSLLAESLPGDQLIISEDGPFEAANVKEHQDFFAEIAQELKQRQIELIFLPQKKNFRFAGNVNQGVGKVKHDFFFLLNNDVLLEKGCRQKLVETILSNEKIFAVTAQEIDAHTKNHAGRNKLWFSRGRFWHARDERLNEAGSTAWACGGSSLYRTKIWRELGGLDTRYYPAYWEDIDISVVAQKQGYQTLYQPQAVVIHAHETTNNDVFGQEKIAKMSWQNGSRFTWKHGNFFQRLLFLFTYPYWLLKQVPAWRYLVLVLLFAAFCRFINLGRVPAGLTVDEAAIAYNGYGIWTQRRDEWLNRLPISFRSFGDYKAPLAIYLNGVSTAIFGLNAFAIRSPFALASVFSLWFFMLLVELLLREKTPHSIKYAAAAGFLMSITPWHLHFGRLGFENNFALLFVLAGVYFLFLQLKTLRTWRGELFCEKWFSWRFLFSGLCFSFSLYSYHSTKIFVPVFLLLLFLTNVKYFCQHWRILVLPLLFSAVLLFPLMKDSFFGQGLTRMNSSYFTDANKTMTQKLQTLGNGFLAHFSPQFLLFGQVNTIGDHHQPNLRHGDNYDGVLNFPILFFIILSLINFVRFAQVRHDHCSSYFLALLFIICGFLPASLTLQVPHNNQAILASPGFIILALLGLLTWKNWWQKHEALYSSFVLLTLILASLSFLQYQKNYYQIFSSFTAQPNNSKYYSEHQLVGHLFAQNLLEAFTYTRSQEKNYQQIIVATNFEQPYIYAILARKTKPISYQGGSLSEKYLFLDKLNFADLKREKSLLLVSPDKIADPENFKPITPLKVYYDLNGEVNLYLYETLN